MTYARSLLVSPLSLFLVSALVAACETTSTNGEPSEPSDSPDASVPSTCPPVTGEGTVHRMTLEQDETWTAEGSPHILEAGLRIGEGKTVTLEPCAVVRLAERAGILVEGKLLAEGKADKPIRIERADPAAAWASIETRKGSELRMSYVTIEGGGNANGGRPTQFGMIDVRGDQDLPPQPIFFADHVTVKGSESLGIWAREGGSFAPGSQNLTVTEGKSFPVLIWGRAAGTLPSGTYTGNTTDEVFLPANGTRDAVEEDMTLHHRGVPYRVGGDTGGSSFVVGKSNGPAPLLTIEAGVTMRFAKGVAFQLAHTQDTADGALHAEGTADKPIVFTSAESSPAAGDWPGILIGGTPDPRDKIAYAEISYAGGVSRISSYGCPSALGTTFANEAAVVVYGGQPAGVFVTHTKIDSSAGDGIVRGWTGDALDFLATNTFTNISRCNQTFPKPSDAVCPSPAPCPK
ncbi:MAG: hypothetical protein KF764_15830 [Labilithrix sp.]|nr:hypothetical protein [Labilithrix sp.]